MDDTPSPGQADRSMTLRIGLRANEPPTGEIVGDDGVAVPFAGWLDLMHAISRIVSGNNSDTAAATWREQPEPAE